MFLQKAEGGGGATPYVVVAIEPCRGRTAVLSSVGRGAAADYTVCGLSHPATFSVLGIPPPPGAEAAAAAAFAGRDPPTKAAASRFFSAYIIASACLCGTTTPPTACVAKEVCLCCLVTHHLTTQRPALLGSLLPTAGPAYDIFETRGQWACLMASPAGSVITGKHLDPRAVFSSLGSLVWVVVALCASRVIVAFLGLPYLSTGPPQNSRPRTHR